MNEDNLTYEWLTTAIILIGDNNCLRYINNSSEVLFKKGRKQVLEKPLASLFLIEHELLDAINQVKKTHHPVILFNQKLSTFNFDETSICNIAISMPDQSSRQVLSHISEQKLDQQEDFLILIEIFTLDQYGRLIKEQQTKERIQANHSVLRGLAHEISNPLGGMRGAAQLLREEVSDKPELMEYTDLIIKEADRLSGLMRRMHSSISADFHQEVNIHVVLEHIRKVISAENNKQIRVIADYDPSLPCVAGNEEKLIQAIMNIVINGVNAITDTGEICLRSRIDHAVIENSYKKPQVVRIDIMDTGCGVDPVIESQIFDPMVTGFPNGTGLGLAITAEILQQHNAWVNFKSEPGKTVFSVYLPLYETQQ